jgi:hypothetical protein
MSFDLTKQKNCLGFRARHGERIFYSYLIILIKKWKRLLLPIPGGKNMVYG